MFLNLSFEWRYRLRVLYAESDPSTSRVFCAVRSAEVFGLRWECDLGKDLFIKHSAWEGKLYERHTKKAKPRKVAVDNRTRLALDSWKEICSDTRPEALMFPSEKTRGTIHQ